MDTEEGEIDIIYANGMKLGTLQGMAPGEERTWTTTVFNLPPQVLQELWTNREVTIFLDIDRDIVGDRVDIGNSILTVNYTTPGGGGGAGPIRMRRVSLLVAGAVGSLLHDQRAGEGHADRQLPRILDL